jgi:UDP-GlcNAc:undecaprenyl-phosphate GlcNAc-1-phosphate transferase
MFLLLPFLAGAVTSAIFTLPTIWAAKRFGLIDDPHHRPHTPARIHQGSIPRAGGLPIFLSILVSSLWFLGVSKKLIGVLAGGGLIVLVGLIDDHHEVSPYKRLVANFAAAALVIGSGVGIPYVTNPFDGIIRLDRPTLCFNLGGTHCLWLPADLAALILIPWMMNMVNWSKGVPGQMPGFVAITASTAAAVAYRFALNDAAQWPVVILSLIIVGAFVGFLPFNFHPQKIMPGYGGGALAGYLLAVLAILSFSKVATVLLVLWIPLIDALFVFGQRLLSGRSPVWGDRTHLHHLLLRRGWRFWQISLFYWSVSAILGVLALNLDARDKAFAALIIGLVIIGGLIWLRGSTTWREPLDRAKPLKT